MTQEEINDYNRRCAEFLKSKGLPYTKFNPRYKGLFNAGICNAESVQEHFEEFKEFVKNNYINTLS